jgi:hypothetical protein
VEYRLPRRAHINSPFAIENDCEQNQKLKGKTGHSAQTKEERERGTIELNTRICTDRLSRKALESLF